DRGRAARRPAKGAPSAPAHIPHPLAWRRRTPARELGEGSLLALVKVRVGVRSARTVDRVEGGRVGHVRGARRRSATWSGIRVYSSGVASPIRRRPSSFQISIRLLT